MRKTAGLIFVVSGPSGSGKTTLVKNILQDKELARKLVRSVSLATRPRRSGEKQGRDYFFISREKFNELLRRKKILEWTKYLGYYYATPKEHVEEQLRDGKNIILCLDLKGAVAIKKLYPRNTITVFIKPPSLDVLTHRIRNRCRKTKAREIKERVRLAEKELSAAYRYDYCLTNQDLLCVTKELKEIILDNINLKKRKG